MRGALIHVKGLCVSRTHVMLSDRGTIFIDTHINTMIVMDTKEHLKDVMTLVETLDRQTP